MKAVLLSGDLMVVSRVQGAATLAGVEVRAVSDAVAAISSCAADQADVLIVDLAAQSLDVAALVHQLRVDGARSVQVVAFGPHVHEDRLAAAREAGCDTVMSRGQFFSQINAVLGG